MDCSSNNPFFQDLPKAGAVFLQAVCDRAVQDFGADFAFVGSLRMAESERMYLLAHQTSDFEVHNTYYNVCPAPCQDVIQYKRAVVHTEGLLKNFPNSPGIQRFGMESYVGFPLLDERGNCIGIYVIEWKRPISSERADQLIAAAQDILVRLAAEVAHLSEHAALHQLMSPLTRDPDDPHAILRAVVSHVAALAKVKGVFIAECADLDQTKFRILASVIDGEVRPDAEGQTVRYDETPCNALKHQDTFLLDHGLQAAFPASDFFAHFDLQSYFGIAYRNAQDELLGHIVLLHDRPMAARIQESELLRTALLRSRHELEHFQTERESKALKEALEVRKKLQSLGLMAGTIAHDFNNLLAAIIGHTELALMDLQPDHPARASIKVAEANLWNARDVIRDLMDFAGNVPEPNFRPVDLNQVVQKSLTTLDPKHHQAHRIETDLQPGLPPVAGHASQLHQVLINLMTNAFEAMPDRQGHLQINTRMICAPVKEAETCLTGHLPNFNGPCILLEIIDNGKGMSPATAQKLFDPFFSTKSNGRGLGLAGVLGIAQRSGVGLTFTTEPGIGTAFRLYFKERRTAVEGPSDEETDRLALAEQGGEDPVRPTILLVDDDPAVCLTVAKQIDTLGYDCLVAESGELALIRAASAQHLSAAIIDLKLPGLSGWDTLTQLRNTHPDLSAVMMSGYGHATPNEKSGDAPGVELLVKPFGFQSLKSALDGALQDN